MKKVISLFLSVVMALSMFSCLSVVSFATDDMEFYAEETYTVSPDTYGLFVPEESGVYRFESFGYGDPRLTITTEYDEGITLDDEKDRDFCGTVYLEAGQIATLSFHSYTSDDIVFRITKVAVPEKVTFEPVKPLQIIENTCGESSYEYVWNEDLGESEYKEYYYYDIPSIYTTGNTITLEYSDGTVDVYTYIDGRFYNEEGAYVEVQSYSNQCYENRWTLGSDNYFTIEVLGASTKVPVSIIENNVKSIQLIPQKPYKFVKNVGGAFEEWYNSETGEYENTYFYQGYSIEVPGNVLRVSYNDNSSEDFEYSYDECEWLNSNGEKLPYDTLKCWDNQSASPWTVGGDNYIVVSYLGIETKIPVSVIESPVKSIEFISEYSYEFIENMGGYLEEWLNPETGEYEEYYDYSYPNAHNDGNILRVHYNDGTTVDYVYSDDENEWIGDNGDVLPGDAAHSYDTQGEKPWVNGGDNYFYVVYLDKEVKVPVTIIENPYKSIEFIPTESIEIKQFTNGEWEYWYDDDADEEVMSYVYYVDEILEKEGNVIKLHKKDGTCEIYTSNGKAFYNSNYESLYYDFYTQDSYLDWGIGNHVVTISACGFNCNVNFNIVENTDVVNNDQFIAEKLTEDTCIITNVTLSGDFDGTLDIPESINGYKVVGIADGAISNGSIRVLNLPSSFSMISEELFKYCNNLREINVSDANPNFASVNGILYNKALTEILCCPNEFNGDFIIKAGVTELSKDVLACLSRASSVDVENGNTSFAFEDDILYNANFSKIYKAFSIDENYVMRSSVKEIAEYAFRDIKTVKTVEIADSVTTISYYAFAGCSSLTDVELPSSLKSIDEGAFYENRNLSSVSFPSSTKNIERGAFMDCSSLRNVEFNEGLESLGSYAFRGADLESVDIPDSLTQTGAYWFAYNYNLSDVSIGSGLTTIPEGAFYSCTKLESIDIPEKVTVIGEWAFSNTGLKSIDLHNKITKIDGAFESCSNLTEVVVPDSVVSMNYAFTWCENLTTARVGSGVRSMDSAFRGCCNLVDVDLAEGITGSFSETFKFCDKLAQIDLPSTVTELSYGQFYGCEELESIDIPDDVVAIKSAALDHSGWYNKQSNGDLYLEDIYYAYKGTMPAKHAVNIKAGTKAIAGSAFEEQTNLISVEIPNGLVHIEGYAFDGCKNLKSVTIPASVEYIGPYAFGYAYNYGRNIIKYEDFTIYGEKGSAANEYADENGFKFVSNEHVHTPGSWIIDKEATCTTKGSKHTECTSCGAVVKTEEIPSLGHKYSTKWTIDKQATCTEEGSKSHHCTVCGANKDITVIPKLDHTQSDWIIDISATYYEEGQRHRECTMCGDVTVTEAIPRLAPATPKLASVSRTASGVKVAWGEAAGAAEYIVYRKTAKSGWTRLGVVEATSFVDTTAKSGTTYYYTVKSVNDEGTAGGYNKTGLAIKFVAAPKLTKIANESDGVRVYWSKVSGADGYYLYRRVVGTSKWTKVATIKKGSTSSYKDKKASSGKNYEYIIKAYDGKTVSAAAAKTIKIKRLTVPKLISAKSGKTGITLKWGKVTGASAYLVYRKTGNGSWVQIKNLTGNTKVTFVDKSAKKGKTYKYTVRAYSGNSKSAYNTKGLTVKDKY